MEPALVLLLTTVATVLVLDLTDFMDSIKHFIWRWVWKNKREYQEFRLKPFDCSLCLSWWIGLGYLIISGTITLPLVVLQLAMSVMTPVIKDIILTIREFVQKIIDTINWYLGLN